jgi:hypothetical protein
LTIQSYSQTVYYVSTSTGNDTRTSTQAQSSATPWKTIQHALDLSSPGCSILVMAGTYREELNIPVSGTSAGGYITLMNYNSDIVLLDGNATAATLLTISGRNYIRIQNIHFTNCIGNNSTGLLVEGTSHHIQILNNKFYDICWSANPAAIPTASKNAQPLIVYGTNGSTAITSLLIEGNELYNNRPGFSEVLAVNGNVDGFSILNNLVHDNQNIGIDIIGHEGTSPTASTDQARNGTIKGNTVYKCHSVYDGSAAGIYVDGGKDLIIENNYCSRNDWGIEIGCENPGTTTSAILVRNNVIYRNAKAGMQLGGYDGPVNTGTVLNSVIRNNTFFSNDTLNDGNGEIALSYSSGCSFQNNIFYATSGVFISDSWGGSSVGLNFDYNIFFTLSGTSGNAEFSLNGNSYTGFSNYKSGTGMDAHSTFQNPLLVSNSITATDVHLSSSSPAKNAGNPSLVAGAVETDMDGEARINNTVVDIGADEVQTVLSILNPGIIFSTSADLSNHLIVSPNPFTESFRIKYELGAEVKNVMLCNAVMQNIPLRNESGEYYAAENIAPGVYYLIIELTDKRVVKKIIRE